MKEKNTDSTNSLIFRSFIDTNEQKRLAQEALNCHYRNCHSTTDWTNLQTSTASLKFDLGIPCGGDLACILPAAIEVARRAFQKANQQLTPSARTAPLVTLRQPETPLTGLALLYGPQASMSAHYDSPTQPGQRQEWLVMMTMGRSVRFRCNQEIVDLQSGDVLVMDSMAVLHGVESIGDDCGYDMGLPLSSRLGILFWQAQSPVNKADGAALLVDGVGSLFPDSSDDENE